MRLLLRFLLLTVLCNSVDVKRGDGHEPVLDEQQAPKTRPLHACALSDFVDEASRTKHKITKSHLRSLMQILKGAGIKTVSWAYYADADGGHLVPRSMQSVTNTYQHLGNPLAVAVAAAHAEGLDVFGYFKPYEMGVSMVSPAGSKEAQEEGHFDLIGGKLVWADPFVAQHPQYCIYGYNQAVLARLENPQDATPVQIAQVRGDAYTEFLVKAKEIIKARGKKMRLNFEVDSLRERIPANRLLAYPANMDVQWKRWIELNLPDEAVIRHYGFSFDQIMKDARTAQIVALLHKRRIPVFFNRYMRSHEKHRFLNDIDTIRSRPEYTGYVFYEVYSYVNYNADGTCTFKYPEIVAAIRHAAQSDPSHE
jgi:hypothetical protein